MLPLNAPQSWCEFPWDWYCVARAIGRQYGTITTARADLYLKKARIHFGAQVFFFPWSHSCWLPWCTVEQGWPGSLWSINIHEGETFLVNYIYVQGNILNQSTCGRSTGLRLKLETVTVSVHARGFRHRINERTCTEQSNLTVQTWHSLYYNQNYIQSLFWTMLYWCHENQVITNCLKIWGYLIFCSSFSVSIIERTLSCTGFGSIYAFKVLSLFCNGGKRMPEKTSRKTTWGPIRKELYMKVLCIHCGWPQCCNWCARVGMQNNPRCILNRGRERLWFDEVPEGQALQPI